MPHIQRSFPPRPTESANSIVKCHAKKLDTVKTLDNINHFKVELKSNEIVGNEFNMYQFCEDKG